MRTLRIALAFSVVVNVFLAAALAGGAAWIQTRSPMIRAYALRIAGDELPVIERKRFRAALRSVRLSQRPLVLERYAAMSRAEAALRAPVFDQKALSNSLEIAREADVRMRAGIEDQAVAVAATLRPADRVKLADAMKQHAQEEPRFLKP